jgi:hypothetical protein
MMNNTNTKTKPLTSLFLSTTGGTVVVVTVVVVFVTERIEYMKKEGPETKRGFENEPRGWNKSSLITCLWNKYFSA